MKKDETQKILSIKQLKATGILTITYNIKTDGDNQENCKMIYSQ